MTLIRNMMGSFGNSRRNSNPIDLRNCLGNVLVRLLTQRRLTGLRERFSFMSSVKLYWSKTKNDF